MSKTSPKNRTGINRPGSGRPQDELIQRMVERRVSQFQPQRIILFGAYARGQETADSDVDLLVVLPVVGSRREKQLEMRMALHDIPIAKDIIVVTPEQVEKERVLIGTLIRPALREGRILYAQPRHGNQPTYEENHL